MSLNLEFVFYCMHFRLPKALALLAWLCFGQQLYCKRFRLQKALLKGKEEELITQAVNKLSTYRIQSTLS